MARRDVYRKGLSPTTVAVLDGKEDVRTWDDEELRHGRRRDKGGKFRGAPPKLIPAACQQELTRRRLEQGRLLLEDSLEAGIRVMVEVMEDRRTPAKDKVAAAQFLIERVMGKNPEKVELSVEAPWMKALQGLAVVGDDEDILDLDSEELE